MLVLCHATFYPHFVTNPFIFMCKWTTIETLCVLNIWALSHETETCSVLCTSYGGQYDRIRSFYLIERCFDIVAYFPVNTSKLLCQCTVWQFLVSMYSMTVSCVNVQYDSFFQSFLMIWQHRFHWVFFSVFYSPHDHQYWTVIRLWCTGICCHIG
jgi:hypothetical protein